MPALALLAAPAAGSLETLRARVMATARRRPGVYQFLDANGGVFYVGKAKDLRARLLSYFSAQWPDSKAAHLVRAAADITWRYQPSEFAALLEELRLIARLRPFSNVRGNRTRRRMVFVKLTGGAAPKLKVTERTTDRAARYFGPFQSHWRTADAVRVLADLLRLRDCAQDRPMRFAGQADLFGASEGPAACLRHELGTCLGPCAAKCTAEAYAGAVAGAADFLESRAVAPLDRVVDAMADASEARDYERAAAWREKLEALESLFAAVSRLRAATEALTFVYGVRDRTSARRGGGHDRVYLVHRGLVRALAPWPRTPIEHGAFAATVARWAAQGIGGPAAHTAPEMDELLLVMSWFRQHPEEYEATTSLDAWLATNPPAAS